MSQLSPPLSRAFRAAAIATLLGTMLNQDTLTFASACSVGTNVWALDLSGTWKLATVQATLSEGHILVLSWADNLLCADVATASTTQQATLCQRSPSQTHPHVGGASGRDPNTVCTPGGSSTGASGLATADTDNDNFDSEMLIFVLVISLGVVLFCAGIFWVMRNHPATSKYLPSSPSGSPNAGEGGFSWTASPKAAVRRMFGSPKKGAPRQSSAQKISPEMAADLEMQRTSKDPPPVLLAINNGRASKQDLDQTAVFGSGELGGGAGYIDPVDHSTTGTDADKQNPRRGAVGDYVSAQLGTVGRSHVKNHTPRSNATPRSTNVTPRQSQSMEAGLLPGAGMPRKTTPRRNGSATPPLPPGSATPPRGYGGGSNTTPRRDHGTPRQTQNTTPRRSNTTPRSQGQYGTPRRVTPR
mmetsp:Transcript_1934/g.4445  ORF Transcript_1934/g.4445 Transcript_1934/m.4445 type:complete len:414 (-) Transcript_1934:497-1738(-)